MENSSFLKETSVANPVWSVPYSVSVGKGAGGGPEGGRQALLPQHGLEGGPGTEKSDRAGSEYRFYRCLTFFHL
jgi:hypothetical protein